MTLICTVCENVPQPDGVRCKLCGTVRTHCHSCRHWDRDGLPSGRMPGVTDHHRKCLRPRLDKSHVEYRRPNDSCQEWKKA